MVVCLSLFASLSKKNATLMFKTRGERGGGRDGKEGSKAFFCNVKKLQVFEHGDD